MKSKKNQVLGLISFIAAINSLLLFAPAIGLFSFTNIRPFLVWIIFSYFILFILAGGTILFFSQKFELKKIVGKMLLTFLPTQLIFLYGIEKTTCSSPAQTCLLFNNLLPIATVIYFLLIGYLIIAYRKKDLPQQENSESWIKKQGWKVFAVLFFVFSLNLGFGLYHLAEKASVDEALWTFGRIPKFWNNVLDGEWHKTDVSDKPGITVALLSGTGLLRVDPDEYENLPWQIGAENTVKTMNFYLRFPILFFNALMLFIFYFFIEKLLGQKTAVLSAILLGLSPILLGISTIINPDSLLWIFLPLSMLSYFVYQKEQRNSYLYWAGIFLGLSLLTKYVANILYIFFFLLIFLEYILHKEKYQESAAAYFKKSLLDYFTLVFLSLLTFLALLPAAWSEISLLLGGTILSQAFQKVWPLFLGIIGLIYLDMLVLKNKILVLILDFFARYKNLILKAVIFLFIFLILATMVNVYSGMKWFDFESILASPKSSYAVNSFLGVLLSNFYSAIFGIIPAALLIILIWGIKNIFFKKTINLKNIIAFYFVLFILLYYIASTVNHVSATVRYQIVIYPIILLIAAIGIREITAMEKIRKYFPFAAVYLILIFSSLYSLNFIQPFYFSYASSLLPKQYVLNLKDMGDGSYEAAQYLNGLPDAKNLSIWTDKRGVCTFFAGNCTSKMGYNQGEVNLDYFVVSSGRESRTSTMTLSRFNGGNDKIIRLDKLYTLPKEETAWKLEIGGRPNNFVQIIDGEKVN